VIKGNQFLRRINMKEQRNLIYLVLAVLFLGIAICPVICVACQENTKAKSNDANRVSIAVQAFELRMSGRVKQATELLEKEVAANPQNAAALFELGRDYFYTMMDSVERTGGTLEQKQKAMKDKLRSAQKAIEKAIKTDPDNARYHYWAGVIGMYNLVYDAHFIWTMPAMPFDSRNMMASYEKAIDLKPDFHQARLTLMGCYDRLPWYCGGNKSKAEQQAKKLEQMDPVYGAKARCEIRPEKTPEEKIAIWEKVAVKLPNNADVHEGLAAVYMNANKTDKALIHIDKALELDVSRKMILLDLARYYAVKKEYGDAEKAIRRFTDVEPKPLVALQACALRQLAGIKERQGNNSEAQTLKKKANELDPTNLPPI
jgi:tetratricopeptide (TPR) repeat protein